MILAVIQQAYCRNVLPTTKENFLEANDYLNFICIQRELYAESILR